MESIVQSIKNFGFRQPLVLDRNNTIVCGHARYEAAAALGIETVPCELASDLSEEQISAYRILDNEIAAQGYTDLIKLNVELEKLPNFDFKPFNIEFPTIETVVEGLTDADDVPAITVNPKTRMGDVWILGNHRLMCGDSTMIDSVEKLMDGKKADMVFTDPPYGVEYQSNMRTKSAQFGILENDNIILDIAPNIFFILKENASAFIWTSHSVYPQWRNQFKDHYKNTIIWYKGCGGMGDLNGNYATDYEMALFCVKGKIKFNEDRGMAVWNIKKDSNSLYEHPTQKPVALAIKAINDLANNFSIIVDLFGGSGSTLIACEETNCKCFMMEISPAYCDVIVNRWQKFTGKDAVLELNGMNFNEVPNG
jgi:site-specific DNA-methyltransferase (adenine-specific)